MIIIIISLFNVVLHSGHPVRSFIPPRWEEQAWMDGAVICNDCVHRLSQYDFVVIMDFDELLVPSPSFNSLFQVLQVCHILVLLHFALFQDLQVYHIMILLWVTLCLWISRTSVNYGKRFRPGLISIHAIYIYIFSSFL